MSTNKKTLIDGDFQVGSAHFYVDVENNRVGLNQVNPTSSLDVNGNAFIGTDMTVASNVTVGSNVIAQKFTGSAAGLTSVPADQISGVIPVENGGTGTTATTGTGSLVKSDNPTFTGTVTADTFSGSGASLTNIPMGQATGTLAVANGGTGVTTSTGTGNTVLSASPTLTGTVTAETANFSSNVSASNVYAGYDTDMTSYLGRAAIGFSGVSDEATFAHVDVNSTNNYALKQTATGETEVNSATSKSVIFSINDSEQARINTTGLGVGTNNPLHKLDVHGTANVGALTCTTISGDGYLLSNVSGYSWPTHANGNDIYYTTGNVGIGTATPGNTLEVAGTASVAILKSAADAATSTYNSILNGPRPGTTSGGAIHFINGSTRTLDGGTSTYTIRNDSGALRLGNVSYNTLIDGNVGIGVTDPDSKLEVRGNIRASFSDTNHGMFIDAGGTIRRDYGGNGAGFHFTNNAIWPTNYLGSYSAGGIDLGSSSYRWNNVYTEALNASGTIDSTGIITCNANKMVITGSSPTLYLRDSDQRTGMIHQNANRMYFLTGPANSDSWAQTANSRWPLYLQMDTNEAVFGGNIDAAVGTVTASTFSATSQVYLGSSASIRQSSTSSWTGDPGSGVGKIEYHSNRWYVVAGSNSSELIRVRRNNSDKFAIDNNGSISLGIVPVARISGLANSATITATSANTANQICQRNGSGDIFCRLFRSDYQNQSDCGAGIAFRNSTTDNYIRFCTDMGAVRARIGCAALAGSTGQNFSANTIYIGNSTSRGLRSVSGNYGTVQTTGGGAGNWEGYSINGWWVFMSDDATNAGIYNDVDNEWALYASRNGNTRLYWNGSEKCRTESTGLYMLGTPEMDGFIRHRGDTDCMFGFSTTDTFAVRTANGERLRVLSTGGLRVYGTEVTTNYASGNRGYFKGGVTTNPPNLGFGLYVAAYVRSSGHVSFSDQRIKSNIVDINDTYALDQLRGLKPKYYNYKDVKERGDESVIGFIAQEVNEVVPRAVSIVDGEIPNIYTHANITSNNTVTFTDFNTSNLESNATTIIAYDRGTVRKELEIAEIVDEHTIRFTDDISDLGCSFDENGNVISVTETITLTPEEYKEAGAPSDCTSNITGYRSSSNVVSIEEYELLTVKATYSPVVDFYTRVVTTYPGTEIFIWGQIVNDFHHLNKDYLWTIGTAALQEVDRQQQADKLRISELETQLASVLTRLDALESA